MNKFLQAHVTIAVVIAGMLSQAGSIYALAENKVPTDTTTSPAKITAEKAKTMMETNTDYILLDVRTPEEFSSGHIPGAILLPDYELAQRMEQVVPDKSRTVIVYCRSGRRSAAAAKELVSMGYTAVFDLGGIISWPYETVK